MKLNADFVLLIGLAIMTIGMALVAFGIVASGLFFAGVYLLGIGLVATAAGAVLRVLRPTTP